MTTKQIPVHVAGVGMIPFTKPGHSATYDEMGAQAAQLALDDAHLDYQDVEHAYVGYVFGDSTAGQAAMYRGGLTGIPIFNINKNCATGSSALYVERQAVATGAVQGAMVAGRVRMIAGRLRVGSDE